jgi:maltodextrin utilization protein YvdJ
MVNDYVPVMKNVTKEHASKEVVVNVVKQVRSTELKKGKTSKTWISQPWCDTSQPLISGYSSNNKDDSGR